MIQKLLSQITVPSDILQAACYALAIRTDVMGSFICVNNINYMDAVVGSMRKRRSSLAKNGVSVAEITDIAKGEFIWYKGIYIYRTQVDWYVGIDNPETKQSLLPNRIKEIIDPSYVAYNILEKYEDIDSNKDYLTGLYTRKEFFNHLRSNFKTMLKYDLPLYLFYMDFNNFKAVNDSLGHDIGDKVIRSISSEIKSIFLGYGEIYRIGGDEFIGITFGVSHEQADKIAKRIEAVSRQAPCGLFVNVSVGVKKFSKEEYPYQNNENQIEKVMDIFLADAESNMYEKKAEIKQSQPLSKIMCSECPHY